jgi:NAD(P)-dependent dehydrogenase (short-subunit alcohol dehydrogenase family)
MNGVRAFMPVLLAQDCGHLLNTSSIFGAFAGTLGPYGVSKHAVTALTETLYFNLKSQGITRVGVPQGRVGRRAGPRPSGPRRSDSTSCRRSGPHRPRSPGWWWTASGPGGSTF